MMAVPTCKICGHELGSNKHALMWCPHCDLPCTRGSCGFCGKVKLWAGTGPRSGR